MEFVVIFILSVVASVSTEAVWSEWKPLGQCSAKPCNCNPERQDNECDTEKIMMVRFCNRTLDDHPCSYAEYGPIKLGECTNNKRNCPGWSDWLYSPCNCDKNDTDRYRWRLRWKECSNPPPLYKSVRCLPKNETFENGEQITIEEVKETLASKKLWYRDEEACPCIEQTTTSTTTTATMTPLDCSDKNGGDDYGNYGGYGDVGNDASEEDPCDYYYNYRK